MQENDSERKKQDMPIPLSYEKPKLDIESTTKGQSAEYATDESIAEKISTRPANETATQDRVRREEPYGMSKPWRKRITAKIEK